MRYAILSDIHSNLEALNAVLEVLGTEAIDKHLCLGDVVGYGADPSACLSALQERDTLVVGGNHDLACVGKLPSDWFHSAARQAIDWTRRQLSVSDVDYLRRLPLTAIEGPLSLAHGTLQRPERFEYLLDLAAAWESVSICTTLMCLVGHTHLPRVVECDRRARRFNRVVTSSTELGEVAFRDDAALCYIVNPGSVGQPRDGDPRASFAIIDTDRRQVAVRRVAYDIKTAQQKIRRAGLPEFLAARLAVGR